MASCRGIFAKFVLCLVNLIFLVMALSVIMLGARMQMVRDSHNDVVLEAFRWKSLSTFFIFLGFILGVISVFGFTAAICESPTLLNVYVYFLALCMTALIVLHGAMIVFRPQLIDEARTYFKKLMSKFHNNVDARYIVHKVHSNFYCCGLNSINDWKNDSLMMMLSNRSGDYSSSNSDDEIGFPISCCGKETTLTGNDSEQTCPERDLIHMDGCFSNVQISRYAFFFRAVFAIVVLLMLLLLTLACCLERDRMLQLSQIINLQYAAHLTSCRTQQQAPNARPGGEYPMLGFEPLYGKRPTATSSSSNNNNSNISVNKQSTCVQSASLQRSVNGSQCRPPSQYSTSSRPNSQQLPPPSQPQQSGPGPQQQPSQSIIYQPINMPPASGFQPSGIGFPQMSQQQQPQLQQQQVQAYQPIPVPSTLPPQPSQQQQQQQQTQPTSGFGAQQPSSLQSHSIRTSVVGTTRSAYQDSQSQMIAPTMQLQPQPHHVSMQQMRYI